MITDSELEEKFPQIDWRSPLKIFTPSHRGIACRYCLAKYGLREMEVGGLPQNMDEWELHMKREHSNDRAE